MSREAVEIPMSAARRWTRLGLWAAGASVAWNVIEGVVAVWAGERSGSVALLGFGIDSFVETASAGVVLWRLVAGERVGVGRAERVEKTAGRWTGTLLAVVAVFIAFESVRHLAGWGPKARESMLGLALTAVSMVLMPALFLVKRRVAREIDSPSVRADAFQGLACWWLSVATFAGLGLNAWLGWAWADPLAGLVLVPLIAREAGEAWNGKGCGGGGGTVGAG